MSFDSATRVLESDYLHPVRSRMTAPASHAATSPLAFDRDLTVGEWLVQPSLDRISREGMDVRLRPQVMNMLVCLARGRGRTVSREQILDEVWPDQSVADTSIARCVAELRKALGDRVQAPSVIETIPKRGYRLIAPVSDVTDPSSGRLPTSAVTVTMPPGAGRAELRLAADPATNPVAGTDTRVENAIETMPPAKESSLNVVAHDPALAAVAVPGDQPHCATGFVWLARRVAAVAALVWPPASR